MALPATLVTEETIATLYDHFEQAAKTARRLLDSNTIKLPTQVKALQSVCDTWTYCQQGLLQGYVPDRLR